MPKRRHQRFIKRLETTFSSGDLKYSGISSDLSESGLFIRSHHAFSPGTILDITLYISEGKISRVKGIVRRALRTSMSAIAKDGMGIELIEKDSNYYGFLEHFGSVKGEHPGKPPEFSDADQGRKTEDKAHVVSECVILTCPFCKVKNRVSRDKLMMALRCGKCHGTLNAEDIS